MLLMLPFYSPRINEEKGKSKSETQETVLIITKPKAELAA